MEHVISFLKSLSRNNNREWFEKNKEKYLQAKQTFEGVVASILEDAIALDDSLAGLDPKKLTFRIFRDVRFSKDKRPYKTNFGAAFSAAGKGMGVPGYYLHIEPGDKSFVAGGLFMPEPAKLAAVRQEIDYNGAALEKLLQDKKIKKLYGAFWDEDKVKTAPKGYSKDHPHIEWLRLKSFIMTHTLKDSEVISKKFKNTVASSFEVIKPLNDFLKEAVS